MSIITMLIQWERQMASHSQYDQPQLTPKAPTITRYLLITMTHNSIRGTPLGSEMVHCTIIQITAEQEQWMGLLELSNYRGSQWWLKMPQAERLSNSLVSTVTFLKESNIYIIQPHLIGEREQSGCPTSLWPRKHQGRGGARTGF